MAKICLSFEESETKKRFEAWLQTLGHTIIPDENSAQLNLVEYSPGLSHVYSVAENIRPKSIVCGLILNGTSVRRYLNGAFQPTFLDVWDMNATSTLESFSFHLKNALEALQIH